MEKLNIGSNLKVGDKFIKIGNNKQVLTIKKIEGDKVFVESDIMPGKLWQWPKEIFDADSVENRNLYQFGNMHVWGHSNASNFISNAYGTEWYTKGYYAGNHNSLSYIKIWYLKDDEYNCGKPDHLSKSRI